MNRLLKNRHLIQIAGFVLLGAAFWFLGRAFVQNWSSIGAWRPTPPVTAALAALAVCYGAMLFLLAESWHRIVNSFGDAPRHRTYGSFTGSQVARYIPGNVAHLLGRALWLRGGSISDGALGRATALEVLVTPTGAVVALLMLAPLLAAQHFTLPAGSGVAGTLLLALGIIASVTIAARHGGRTGFWIGQLQFPVLLSAIFMLLLGAIFASICNLVGTERPVLAIAAAIAAWVAGYATPGAPGGLGVREAVLVMLLSDTTTTDTILLASVLLRIVTTIGELACFATGMISARYFGSHPT